MRRSQLLSKGEQKTNGARLRHLPDWLIELSGLVVVTGATLVEIVHVMQTGWARIYLYDGDSLTLPLLQQSLAHHEPFKWVFSSQLNLFPEGIFYAVATLFTRTVTSTLVLSAVFNVLLFYLLVRLILRVIAPINKQLRRLYGLLCTLILLALMLLEVPSLPALGQSSTTYFLFTTYYGGSILVGLFNIAVIALILKPGSNISSQKRKILLGVTAAFTGLAVISNPLYIIEFILPFIAVLLVLAVMRLVGARKTIWLIVLQLSIVAVGLVARLFMKEFIGESLLAHLSNILSIQSWKSSFFNILSMLSPYGPSSGVKIRILLSCAVYFACLFAALITLNRHLKRKGRLMPPHRLFVLIFTAVNPLIVGIILSSIGAAVQRYFIASIILPLLGLLVLAGSNYEKKIRRYAVLLCLALGVTFLLIGTLRITNGRLTADYPDEACLARALDYQPANGIASYTIARPLDVFNSYNERVLQVYGGIGVLPWLNNLGSYENKQFSFVLVENDGTIEQHYQRPSPDFTVVDLGTATKQISCPTFTVYVYPAGSAGNELLNRTLNGSLQSALKARREGRASSFNSFRNKLR